MSASSRGAQLGSSWVRKDMAKPSQSALRKHVVQDTVVGKQCQTLVTLLRFATVIPSQQKHSHLCRP